MKLIDIALLLGLAAVLALIGLYLYRTKKSGRKCIGCPEGTCSGTCSGNCGSCPGCGGQTR